MEDRNQQQPPPTIPTDKARQGRGRGRVLVILVVSLILAAIVWWLVEIYGSQIAPPEEEQVGDPATIDEPAAVPPPVE